MAKAGRIESCILPIVGSVLIHFVIVGGVVHSGRSEKVSEPDLGGEPTPVAVASETPGTEAQSSEKRQATTSAEAAPTPAASNAEVAPVRSSSQGADSASTRPAAPSSGHDDSVSLSSATNPVYPEGTVPVTPHGKTPSGPAATPSAAGKAEAGVAIYTVRPGDSLTKLARTHGCTIKELAQLNGVSQQKLAKLQVGQKLKVPAK